MQGSPLFGPRNRSKIDNKPMDRHKFQAKNSPSYSRLSQEEGSRKKLQGLMDHLARIKPAQRIWRSDPASRHLSDLISLETGSRTVLTCVSALQLERMRLQI